MNTVTVEAAEVSGEGSERVGGEWNFVPSDSKADMCLQVDDPERAHSRFLDFGYGIPWRGVRDKPFSKLNRLALMRTITYMIHVKLLGSNNRQGGIALKSHCFSVAHDGPSIASEHMAVNMGCLAAFTVTFIGRETAFRALCKALVAVSILESIQSNPFSMACLDKGGRAPSLSSSAHPCP